MEQQNKSNTYAWWAFLLYAVAFVAYTWPLCLHFSTSFIGRPETGDASTYVWNIWHFRYAVVNGLNPFFTDKLFYPEGTSLLMHAYTPIAGLLNLLINRPILTLNIVLLFSFVLSGLGTFQLLKHFGIHPLLCMAGGFIFAFCPYKTAHLAEHFNLELTACIPYFILYVFKTFQFTPGRWLPAIQSRRSLWLLILICMLSLLSDYYYSIYLFYFTCIFATANALLPAFKKLSLIKKIIGILLVVMIGHITVRLFSVSGVDDKGALWWNPDFASLFVPPSDNILFKNMGWVRVFENRYFRYPESTEFIIFPGLCMLALLFIYFFKNKWQTPLQIQPINTAAFVFLSLCFPIVVFMGHQLFYSGGGLVYFIPFLNNVRTPSRYILMTILMALPALLWVASQYSRHRYFTSAAIALIILVFSEFYPVRYTMLNYKNVPEVYAHLKQMPQGAVLPLPFGMRDGTMERGHFNTNHYFYQTIHEKPIIGGYISRLSKAALQQIENSSTARECLSIMDNKGNIYPIQKIDLPVKYIVVEDKKFEAYMDSAMELQSMTKTAYGNYLLYEIK